MRERLPSLLADDIIQEIFEAFAKALFGNVYNPEANRYFHNYLSILRKKVLEAFAAHQRDELLRQRAADASVPSESFDDADYRKWGVCK